MSYRSYAALVWSHIPYFVAEGDLSVKLVQRQQQDPVHVHSESLGYNPHI